MIVFRENRETLDSARLLDRVVSAERSCGTKSAVDHQCVVDLVITFGEFETALADYFSSDTDHHFEVERLLRDMGKHSGRLLIESWRRGTIDEESVKMFSEGMRSLTRGSFPATLTHSVMEGFAFYGLYPETYYLSACHFLNDRHPQRVTVIGLRSIGTVLSSVVAAALEKGGCTVRSFTVRPRGHPFDRQLKLSEELTRDILGGHSGFYAIVDEGPGLSGSSLCGAAGFLAGQGVPLDRIVLFPSWNPDGDLFVSVSSRELWKKLVKFTATFEETWIDNGKLAGIARIGSMHDISAGAWRSVLYARPEEYPAVHPHHERRKYLAELLDNKKSPVMLKFAGLGSYGRTALKRARALADQGFSPEAIGLCNGFIIYRFESGVPMGVEEVSVPFLDRIAGYLAHIARFYKEPLTATFDKMNEMIVENVKEGLGDEWVSAAAREAAISPEVYRRDIVAIDGRMAAHKWISVDGHYRKTDHTDHHADQFFHGSQNIAWDLAGSCIELRLSDKQRHYLSRRYGELSGDMTVSERFPYYLVAYTAFRLGYTDMAEKSLPPSLDKNLLSGQRDYYRTVLKRELLSHE